MSYKSFLYIKHIAPSLSTAGFLRCIDCKQGRTLKTLRTLPGCWAWCQERAIQFSYSKSLMPCESLRRGMWRDWRKGRTSGHLTCWSPCPQTLLTKGPIFGLLPFSSFISTEEWLELSDLFHQHLRLKLNCRVLVKNELKPFLKSHSAILMSIFYQEGRREKFP